MNDQVVTQLLFAWLVSIPVLLVVATLWKSFVLVRLWGVVCRPFLSGEAPYDPSGIWALFYSGVSEWSQVWCLD